MTRDQIGLNEYLIGSVDSRGVVKGSKRNVNHSSIRVEVELEEGDLYQRIRARLQKCIPWQTVYLWPNMDMGLYVFIY